MSKYQRNFNVIVIGGGHNGLVTAAYLARAGAQVVVLEARPLVGGIATTEEICPGFWVDTVLHSAATFRPRIVRELFLKMYDFGYAGGGPHLFLPLPDGRSLTLGQDVATSEASIRALSVQDADRFLDYCLMMERHAAFIEKALAQAPPDVTQLDTGQLLPWLGVGASFRAMGEEMYELLRVLPMSLVEWMDRWFQHPAVRAAVSAPGVIGLRQGPFSAGTAFLLLYHMLGQRTKGGIPAAGIVRGGTGRLTQALAAAAYQFGAEIRTNSPVAEVRLRDGRATGVVLANGDELMADVVVSAVDPRRTFTELVDPYELDPSFNRAIANIKFRGATAKVNLALDRLPSFTALPAGDTTVLQGRIQIGPSLEYIEQAYDAAKYGRFSTQPFLDIIIPTLHDPSLAPAGKHTMSILVQYAPYELREGSWPERAEALGDTVIDTLAAYAPDIRDVILERQVLTPADLEARYGLTEGSLYHGEMMLDQLFIMRPVPGWSQYRTPIDRLYLCGSGSHPGGGLTGEPGRLAAEAILHDAKKG